MIMGDFLIIPCLNCIKITQKQAWGSLIHFAWKKSMYFREYVCRFSRKLHYFCILGVSHLKVFPWPQLAEWRSGSVSALPCERPGFTSRTRLREIIPANNCTMQGQNNWGNWGFPGVMKLWVAWEVLRWLMQFRELCSGVFHPKLVTPPYHGFLNVNTPLNSQNSKRH